MNCFLVVKTEKLCLRNTYIFCSIKFYSPKCQGNLLLLFMLPEDNEIIHNGYGDIRYQTMKLLVVISKQRSSSTRFFNLPKFYFFFVNTGAKPLSLSSFQYDNGKLMMQKSLTGYCPNHFLLISIKLHFYFR